MIEVIIPIENRKVFCYGWSNSNSDIKIWLDENIGVGSFGIRYLTRESQMWCYEGESKYGCFRFRTLEDAVIFKLTWG